MARPASVPISARQAAIGKPAAHDVPNGSPAPSTSRIGETALLQKSGDAGQDRLTFVRTLGRIGDPNSRLNGMEMAIPKLVLTSEPTEARKFLRDVRLRSGTPRPEAARLKRRIYPILRL
jgi:hypothetical protein